MFQVLCSKWPESEGAYEYSWVKYSLAMAHKQFDFGNQRPLIVENVAPCIIRSKNDHIETLGQAYTDKCVATCGVSEEHNIKEVAAVENLLVLCFRK